MLWNAADGSIGSNSSSSSSVKQSAERLQYLVKLQKKYTRRDHIVQQQPQLLMLSLLHILSFVAGSVSASVLL